MVDDVKRLPEKTLFAQVDTLWAIKDYPPVRNCARLIGVDEVSFVQALFNSESGCQTYILDIDWRDLPAMAQWSPSRHGSAPCTPNEDGVSDGSVWLRIDYQIGEGIADSYAYPAFEGADPTYIRVQRVSLVPGATVNPVPPALVRPPAPNGSSAIPFQLTAFHVGQGMCSVLHGPSSAYVLDAGAGTPVSRKDYLSLAHDDGTIFVNELRPLIASIPKVAAILSHPDADHWRLLDWDVTLLAGLEHVYLPAGEPALAFSAPRVKPKVVGLGDHTFMLNARNWLDVRRSSPTRKDKNGQCLVSVAHCEGRQALLPGDYVYERMLHDANASIRQMAADQYDAVVVPHHGDKASASRVVRPRQMLHSKAFFSAGTHTGYGHPTPASILGHMGQGFLTIDEHERRDVIGRRLLP